MSYSFPAPDFRSYYAIVANVRLLDARARWLDAICEHELARICADWADALYMGLCDGSWHYNSYSLLPGFALTTADLRNPQYF